jgi:uncharacterized protein YndB with AHSA1/START domain
MKYRLELPIQKSREEVWEAFDNPENMSKWQPSLVRFEPASGTRGRPGAVSKLTYSENNREFVLMEKVTAYDEPNELDGVYENEFADNSVKNTFIEQGKDQTLWVMETEFRFKTLLMRILGPVMKKNFVIRTRKDMERFKEMVEGD